jgi:hypothetical protein
MTYAINRDGQTIWREGAKADELARVAQIDTQLESLEWKRAALTNERRLVINRACQRQRYQTKKNAVSHEKAVDVSHSS